MNKLKFSVTHINIRHMDYQDADMVQELHDNQLSTTDLGVGGKPDAWWRCTQEKPYMEWHSQTFVGGKGQWHKRNIFQRGQSHFSQFFFPAWNMFFPGKNFPFWYTPHKFQWFQKATSKIKEKKKKSPLLIFILFPLPFSIFHVFPFKLPSFPLHFPFIAPPNLPKGLLLATKWAKNGVFIGG